MTPDADIHEFAARERIARVRRPRLIAVAVAATLCASMLAAPFGPGGSRANAAVVAVPSKGVLFGASVYTPAGRDITDLESDIGRTLTIERSFSQWDDAQPSRTVRRGVAAGRVPLLSIRPQLHNGRKLSWASVASGARDTDIRRQAAALKSLNRPVMLAFHHEADLSKGYGTAADFRAAFRHYVSVMRSTGAKNVSFVVVLAAYTWGSAIARWYPGDSVVDWAGADAYNFAGCNPGRPAWRSFRAATDPFRKWGATHNKPQVLAEWGTAEDPAVRGRKAKWITEAGVVMRSWPRLRAAAYFDQRGSCDWRLTTSSSSFRSFRTLARSVYANGNPTGRLALVGLRARTASWNASASTGSFHITGHGISGWSFSAGDGSAVQRRSGSPTLITHRYRSPGHYTATLTVRDARGRSTVTHRSVTIP